MKWRRAFFFAALAVLGGWMAYLASLSLWTAKPIVLSRPQLLVSNLVVVAEVDDLTKPIRVKDVSWPIEEGSKLSGTELRVSNLTDCRDSWSSPGVYIVPLMTDFKAVYRVAPVPASPGFAGSPKPQIYPWDSRTQIQLDSMRRPSQLPGLLD